MLAAGASTLLGAGRPRVRRDFVAHEVRLERQHPGDREHHGRIVRDQARRRDADVILGREELQERFAEAVGGDPVVHRRSILPTQSRSDPSGSGLVNRPAGASTTSAGCARTALGGDAADRSG